MATPASMVERALEAFGTKAKVPPSVALLAGKDAIIPPIHLPCTSKGAFHKNSCSRSLQPPVMISKSA